MVDVIGVLPHITNRNDNLELAFILKILADGGSVYHYSYDDHDVHNYCDRVYHGLTTYKWQSDYETEGGDYKYSYDILF